MWTGYGTVKSIRVENCYRARGGGLLCAGLPCCSSELLAVPYVKRSLEVLTSSDFLVLPPSSSSRGVLVVFWWCLEGHTKTRYPAPKRTAWGRSLRSLRPRSGAETHLFPRPSLASTCSLR